MKRRDFLSLGAVVAGANVISGCMTDNTSAATATPTTNQAFDIGDALTYYTEMRVAPPANNAVLTSIESIKNTIKTKSGYLSFSFKQMTGESTMVKNYPNDVKGVLREGYADADGNLSSTKVPYFYSLFVRFDSMDNLKKSNIQGLFEEQIVPKLFAYKLEGGAPVITPVALDYYEGIFKTVAAGDTTDIYKTQDKIKTFLKTQSDEVTNNYVTVANHVMIKDKNLDVFNEKVTTLLTIAQTTYQPNDESGNGTTGTVSDTNYRKAVTTEILQNIDAYGDLRAYLMHGVWENVYDHENSHLDPRFQEAAGPVGSYVVVGPVEPFYRTEKQDLTG